MSLFKWFSSNRGTCVDTSGHRCGRLTELRVGMVEDEDKLLGTEPDSITRRHLAATSCLSSTDFMRCLRGVPCLLPSSSPFCDTVMLFLISQSSFQSREETH